MNGEMLLREKLHDALENQNVRAFLRAIRLGEGTSDARGYRRLVGGGEFSSYIDHPNRLVAIQRYGVKSTAAGAYQIIHRTWKNLSLQYGFGDFSPSSQDEAAVALVREKGALDDVIAGRVETAVAKCAPVWASLPGSTAGQRTETLAAVVGVYQQHGGTLA